MHLSEVVIRPVITEQSSLMANEKREFVFEVDVRANKIEIKAAIEALYNVDVLKVRTIIMPRKLGTRGRKQYVRVREWKKAIITLPEGQVIPDFSV